MNPAAQRDKEAELLFVGDEMRRAIASYYHRGPVRQYPATLEDLLKDPRFPQPVRHLRQRYRDPVTNSAEWGLVLAQGGGIMGVYSLSEARPFKRANFAGANASFADRAEALGEKITYRDWQFVYIPGMPGVWFPR